MPVKRWIVYLPSAVALLSILVWLGLPRMLTAFGLHPHYKVPEINLEGRRALIIATRHDTFDPVGNATGVFAYEMTPPYYAFLDAWMEADVAGIKGGPIPVEPVSLRWHLISPPDRRYMNDQAFLSRVKRSFDMEHVDREAYDIVFLAGGWGAACDFAQSDGLGEQISRAYAAGAVAGGVCHGPLGLIPAKGPDGRPLVEGRRISAVTDKQIDELGIDFTPQHPERGLRAARADFEAETAFRDFFGNHVVVDGRIVTGQNQNNRAETAHRMMEAVLAGSTEPR